MLSPTGFRIPNEFDREALFTLLNFNLAGSKMKSIDTSYWNQPNLGSTNSRCFLGLPGGVRSDSGGGRNFHELGNAGWFIFKNSNDNSPFFRGLLNGADIFEGTNALGYYNYFTNVAGTSVRCIKE